MAVLSPGAENYLQLLTPQNLNKFDVMIYPSQIVNPQSSNINPATVARQTVSTALDSVARFHIQGITFNFNSFEYGDNGLSRYVSNLVLGQEGLITFIEDEKSTVRNYILSWINLMYYYDATQGNYIFRDNQNASKKNMKILLYDGRNKPNYVWVTLENVRPKAFSTELNLNQLESEPYIINLPYIADHTSFSSPLTIAESVGSSGGGSASSIF